MRVSASDTLTSTLCRACAELAPSLRRACAELARCCLDHAEVLETGQSVTQGGCHLRQLLRKACASLRAPSDLALQRRSLSPLTKNEDKGVSYLPHLDNPRYVLKKTFIKKAIGQFGLAPTQIKKTIRRSMSSAPISEFGAKIEDLGAKKEEMPRTGLRQGLQS